MMIMDTNNKALNGSLDKALKLLAYFTSDRHVIGLSELSRLSGMPKATVYRLISTLKDHGFINKVSILGKDNQYKLGLRFLEYGKLVSEDLEIRKIALPYMELLRDKVNECVQLIIKEKLLKMIAEDRQRGYTISYGELELETVAIGAPIFDYTGSVTASISVAGPESRFTEKEIPYLVDELLKTTKAISKALGRLAFNIGNIAGAAMGVNVLIGMDMKVAAVISAVIAILL